MGQTSQSVEIATRPDHKRGIGLEMGRVMVLGLNAWTVMLLLPMILASPRSATAILWLVPPLLPLTAGIAALPRSRPLSAWLLLGGFPIAVVAIMAALPALVVDSPFSTPGVALGALCLCAFGAAAALSAGRPRQLRETSTRPLTSVAPTQEHTGRRWVRRAVLFVTTAGAAALAWLAPAVGDRTGYQAAWGDTAREAATLTAVVGGALAVSIVALFVGPSLRASRTRPPSSRRVRRRVGWLLLSVAIGAAFYLFYVLG